MAVVVTVVLILGFYSLFNYFINKPLKRTIAVFDNIKEGNLSIKLPAEKDDEFGLLGKHFNHMVSELSSSKEKIEELHNEQLLRADKMITLGELAAEMAHEINNPAAIMMSRVDYLQLESTEKSELVNYQEDFEVLLNQVEKISKITNSILKYSKKLPKNFHSFDLVQIIDEYVSILEPILIMKNIAIIKNFKTAETKIFGDPLQIGQVLTNLINNAIDAIEKDGEIQIELSSNRKNNLKISIIDDGDGIDEDIKKQIFSPFFTTKPADKGTGLGLYIVKNICKNHNANIKCSSTSDSRTEFSIVFRQSQ